MKDTLIINEKDNVAVRLAEGEGIPAGHKYALCDIAEGDIVSYGGEKLRVISVDKSGEEFSVHLESVQIIDTGAFVLKGDNNV